MVHVILVLSRRLYAVQLTAPRRGELESTMSKTDQTRPYRVAYDDPYNRKFRHIGNFGWPKSGTHEHMWKKITSCRRSTCCGKHSPWRRKDAAKRRYGWRREVNKLLTIDNN